MDTNNQGNPIGGGEILDYMNGSVDYDKAYKYMDNDLIKQFNMISFVAIIVSVLILTLLIVFILKRLKKKSLFIANGISRVLEHTEAVRKRDAAILRTYNFIDKITKFIESTPLRVSKSHKDYYDYNLYRAGIKVAGGTKQIKAEEFNALIKLVQILGVLVGLLVTLLVSIFTGISLILMVIIAGNVVPMMVIRSIVMEKDDEIKLNFSDFYLMIHYVLIARSVTSLTSVMKSYDKTTDSAEMHKLVDVCIYNIDTYGEYEGTTKIANYYKEIHSVRKLMRLIRQSNQGGDVVAELKGFREELLDERKYAMQRHKEKLINRANMSFYILMPILFQAIISAMAIYFDDLSIATTFFG